MFTGLVEETAPIAALVPVTTGACLKVRACLVAQDAKLGDSIAVNGCCLTITSLEGGVLSFDLLAETLLKTNLGGLRPGSFVNLERALPANGRLGGHFVQGHVDCTSQLLGITPRGQDHMLEVALPKEFAKYVAYKGSIAINGISLTTAEVREGSLVVWIIPHTMAMTNLGTLAAGDYVNLEFDMLAKYLERLVSK
jgi:riboflavin synthase